MKRKEGTNIIYASNQELAQEGYVQIKGPCKPGDLLLAAKSEPQMLIELSAGGIRHSGANGLRDIVFRKAI